MGKYSKAKLDRLALSFRNRKHKEWLLKYRRKLVRMRQEATLETATAGNSSRSSDEAQELINDFALAAELAKIDDAIKAVDEKKVEKKDNPASS